jgi:hypothetical protein
MILRTLLITWTLIWALPLRAQLGLAVAPMRTEIRIAAGEQFTDTIRVSNDSAARTRVRADSLDWYIDDQMTPQFADAYPKEAGLSCREWLQINPRESEIEPDGTTRSRYTLQIPAGTREGEYHCGLGFVTLPPVNEPDSAIGVRMAVRAVSTLYVLVGSPTSQPVLKGLSLISIPDGTWQATVRFENQGSKTFRVKGFVELRNSDGQPVEHLEYASIPVLPKREQLFLFPLKTALPPGSYSLYTQADVGLAEIYEGSVRVTVNTAR